jgi:hypothetical protein
MEKYSTLKQHLIREKRIIRLLYFFIGTMVGTVLSYLIF